MNLTPTLKPRSMTVNVDGKTERVRFFRAEISACMEQKYFVENEYELQELNGRIAFMANQEMSLIRNINRQKYSV